MLVDTLVLELGLDPRKFTDQQRAALTGLRQFQEEAERGGKRVESETKRIGNVLQDFRREAVTVLGVFLGGRGIKEFIGYVTSLDAQTGRLAKTMGVSANELSLWQNTFKQVGGSAESASSALAGINQEIVKFSLTGQSSMLGVLTQLGVSQTDGLGRLKTAAELYLDIIKAIEDRKLSPREATGLLSMIPGMNQDAINLALKGTVAVRGYMQAARDAGVASNESADQAEKFQRSMALLETSSTSLGRTLVNFVTPALVKLMDTTTSLFAHWQRSPEQTDKASKISREKVNLAVGTPEDYGWARGLRRIYMRMHIGNEEWAKLEKDPEAFQRRYDELFKEDTPAAKPAPPAKTSARPTAREQESYIRAAAIKRGIDPNIAVDVARSEGLNKYVGDQGTSFGPFQLHYKNNIPGLSNSGLGDEFTKRTGKHASDPSTWQHQVDFALDEAKKSGWGAWHGWKGLPFAGLGRMPGAGAAAGAGGGSAGGDTNTTTSVQIGTIQVNAPNAKDGEEVGRAVGPAITRSVTAGFANSGAQ